MRTIVRCDIFIDVLSLLKKDMTTIEQNRIIVEFMKYEKSDENEYHIINRDGNGKIYLNERFTGISHMNFDNNWQWLIPAWAKFATECWNKGIGIDYICSDFNDCVCRDAPKTACEILANAIKRYI